MPAWPVPVQSPARGIQPGAPNWNGVKLGAPALLVVRTYQVSVAGSTTATVVRPLPVQSPTSPIQPTPPNLNWPASGVPAPVWFDRYHVPVVGSKAPTVRGTNTFSSAAAEVLVVKTASPE